MLHKQTKKYYHDYHQRKSLVFLKRWWFRLRNAWSSGRSGGCEPQTKPVIYQLPSNQEEEEDDEETTWEVSVIYEGV